MRERELDWFPMIWKHREHSLFIDGVRMHCSHPFMHEEGREIKGCVIWWEGISEVVRIRWSAYDMALHPYPFPKHLFMKSTVLMPLFISSHAWKIGSILNHWSRLDDDPKALIGGAIRKKERENDAVEGKVVRIWWRVIFIQSKWHFFMRRHSKFTVFPSFSRHLMLTKSISQVHHEIMISHHPMMKIQWL